MLTRQLVQQEIDKGWVFPFEGTLQDAQQQYPLGVALGKLGIAHSDGRPPSIGLRPNNLRPQRALCDPGEKYTTIS